MVEALLQYCLVVFVAQFGAFTAASLRTPAKRIPDAIALTVHSLHPERAIAHQVNYESIKTMLELETPNLHELDLDRVIA